MKSIMGIVLCYVLYLAIHLFLRRSYFVTRMHYALSTIVESIMIFTLAILCTLAGS